MKRFFPCRKRSLLSIIALCSVIGIFVVVIFWLDHQTGNAFPEYAARTGESCATCHVSPGGGGPRTLRGLLWAAQGRPDNVPEIPGMLMAPGVMDGVELYDIACAGCHGFEGEGLFGMGLIGTNVPEKSVESFILRGIPTSGMPSFKGQFTDQQLDLLAQYVAGFTSGAIDPAPSRYPLAPMQWSCGSASQQPRCGGN